MFMLLLIASIHEANTDRTRDKKIHNHNYKVLASLSITEKVKYQ